MVQLWFVHQGAEVQGLKSSSTIELAGRLDCPYQRPVIFQTKHHDWTVMEAGISFQ